MQNFFSAFNFNILFIFVGKELQRSFLSSKQTQNNFFYLVLLLLSKKNTLRMLLFSLHAAIKKSSFYTLLKILMFIFFVCFNTVIKNKFSFAFFVLSNCLAKFYSFIVIVCFIQFHFPFFSIQKSIQNNTRRRTYREDISRQSKFCFFFVYFISCQNG